LVRYGSSAAIELGAAGISSGATALGGVKRCADVYGQPYGAR
jgi:hypothetical protein